MTLSQLLSHTLLPSNPIDDISNNIISVQRVVLSYFQMCHSLFSFENQNATTVFYELYLLAPTAC